MSRIKSNFPTFELAIIASLVGVGWVLFEVYGRLDDVGRQRLEPVPRSEARHVRQLTFLATTREQYLDWAGQVTNGMRLMRDGLDAFVSDRTVTATRYLREAGNLQRRLADFSAVAQPPEYLRVRSELVTNTWLRSETTLTNDLDQAGFLASLTRAVSNHIAAINITDAQPLTPEIVQRKIEKAAESGAAVLALTAEAGVRAERLNALLERRGVDLVSPFVPNNLAERARAQAHTYEQILRFLAAVFLLQAVVLIVAFYRRLVVLPLHQRIIENATSEVFQRKLDHFARLATGLAHEIRNPLTAINIRLFTLQKSLAPGGAQHADTLLIRNEIDRLEQILKDFLRLARPSEPKLSRLTARPLLDETRNLLSEQCRRQGVELRVEKAADTPFLGDSVQLKQVLINLVQNASESIAGRGRVTLRAYEDHAENGSSTAPDRSIVLEVEDNGSGIAPDVQERLFDPFFSTKDNGTGLGLPIAAKIVDQHKGRLEFETRAERGTTFRVILPVQGRPPTNA